jgi:hypothetical protein
MQKFNPKALGLACGVLWALVLCLLALVSMIHGNYGNTIIGIMSSLYLGYDNTIPGAMIGAIWAFIDAFIGGYAFAWLYNKFLST